MLHVRAMDSGLTMTGALDHDGGRELLRAVASVRGDVRLDASRVQRIDGAGLTALAIARNRCRADGRTFELVAIAPEAVEGLRAGDHVRTLFAAPHAADAAVVDAEAPAPPPLSPGFRRRFSINLHRHQEQ